MESSKVSVDVTPFQLLQWKHAIKLEAVGIKVARRSVRAHAARVFGCKRSEVAEHIEAALDACKAAGVPPHARADISLV